MLTTEDPDVPPLHKKNGSLACASQRMHTGVEDTVIVSTIEGLFFDSESYS